MRYMSLQGHICHSRWHMSLQRETYAMCVMAYIGNLWLYLLFKYIISGREIAINVTILSYFTQCSAPLSDNFSHFWLTYAAAKLFHLGKILFARSVCTYTVQYMF